jgi:Terminase RNaseH-like domain
VCHCATTYRHLDGQHVGGIDFGFRNPFAAVWGTLDRDDVLWLTGEHYARGKPISYHADRLPRRYLWYCDPAGAGERCQLLLANFKVRPGINAVRQGIAAVTARLESGTLRVQEGRCPNLLAEARLYRYGGEGAASGTEVPLSEHNHALDALRYLIGTLDAHRRPCSRETSPDASAPSQPRATIPWWLDPATEHLWTRIF